MITQLVSSYRFHKWAIVGVSTVKKVINPKYFEYDEPTERLAKEMIKDVLDQFPVPEREIVTKDEDFIQTNFIQIIYRLNEGKLGEMFLKYVFHMIVEKYVKNEIKKV